MKDYRSAVSLGNCTGSLNVELLFQKLQQHKLLDKYLEDILGNNWSRIKALSLHDKLKYYLNNFKTIKIKLKKHTQPTLG